MPTSGEVIICGQKTSTLSSLELSDVRLTKCGFVFQFHFLLPEFTALENVLLPMRTLGDRSAAEMRSRAKELLISLGLDQQVEKRPHQLSGGQRQRVALARALANDPPLILADEPTGNLDTVSTEQVFNVLRDIAHSGRTVVVVTHDNNLAERADRRIHIVGERRDLVGLLLQVEVVDLLVGEIDDLAGRVVEELLTVELVGLGEVEHRLVLEQVLAPLNGPDLPSRRPLDDRPGRLLGPRKETLLAGHEPHAQRGVNDDDSVRRLPGLK